MDFDLLYPEGTISAFGDNDFAALCRELSLDRFITSNVAEFYTSDPRVISFRQELFYQLLRDEKLICALKTMHEKLNEYEQFRSNSRITSRESLFTGLLNVGFYVDFIRIMAEQFAGTNTNASAGIKKLADFIYAEACSEKFRTLEKNLEKLGNDIHHVKSITLGINLGVGLNPIEAGVVSLNSEPYKSSSLIDRLLRLDFEKGGFHCIAPLTSVKGLVGYEEQLKLNEAVYATLEKISNDSVKKCHLIADRYFYDSMSAFTKLRLQIGFIIRASEFLSLLKEYGLPLVRAEVTNGAYIVDGLYNPALAIEFKRSGRTQNSIVRNRLTFDDSGRIFILTGPNSGGKTVYLRAAAYAQAMFQLGLPVPASEAKMPVCDRILTAFPKETTEGVKSGRLEEECKEMSSLLAKCGRNSLVLTDELFSSTSAADGEVLARSSLDKLAASGCRCIFSTHLHGLCDSVETLNRADGEIRSKFDLLAAGANGRERTYIISRGQRGGASDAFAIAEKYGLY